MHYTIYKTTNLINGKFYIGKHQTTDPYDDYLGSGKYLNRAIKKYGRDNFIKEILCCYDNEKLMNLAEKVLVIVDSEVSYNICKGGHGGFGYINTTLTKKDYQNRRKAADKIIHKKYGVNNISQLDWVKRKIASIRIGQKIKSDNNNSFLGKTHSKETKKKMSLSHKGLQSGPKNSQYGTCWITNGKENKKIPKYDLYKWIELGYNKGRIMI